MKKYFFLIAMFLSATISFSAILAYGPSDSDEFLTSDAVESKDTSGLIEGDVVDALPTKTPKPAPTLEPVEELEPEPVPTPRPKPTAVPTPKPRPTVKRAAPTPVPTPVPTAVPARPQAVFPGILISKSSIDEIALKKSADNLFGLLATERKFKLTLTLENKGATTSYYTVATLKSGHTSVLMPESEKNIGTVLPGTSLELVYPVIVLASYDGDVKLPLSLKVTANGLSKEFPVDVYIDEAENYLLYLVAGLIILLLLILIIMLLRGKKETPKKGKDYDFNM
ncbi:MAG TPA: hypothetical protein P5511_03170 [Candidatus Goldiibacteriota bacterium]|nr:hypothetical protein [Candidatus Goldiibacteriota bacterium]